MLFEDGTSIRELWGRCGAGTELKWPINGDLGTFAGGKLYIRNIRRCPLSIKIIYSGGETEASVPAGPGDYKKIEINPRRAVKPIVVSCVGDCGY
jgi:hypothetical protein